MTIYWPETQHADDSVNEDAAALLNDDGGLAFEVPQEVLRRHGARVLEPSDDANSSVGRALRPTAYVSSVLLIPRALLTPKNNESLNTLLNPVGMRLPEFGGEGGRDGRPEAPTPPDELEIVPVVLRPAGQSNVVDAWTALQAIRSGAEKDLSNQISLDHLMFASRWNGDLGGVPGPIQGFVPFGPGTPESGYLNGPVALELPAIQQRNETTLALGRRPVVAVLDTGIGQNDWLMIPPLNTQLPVEKWRTGPYVKIDAKIQQDVETTGRYLQRQDQRVEVITHPKDEPLTRNPLIGTQAWCFGHGVFCAGVVQQIAPDATVLAIRVMGSDGVARESAVVAALKGIVKRIDGEFGVPPQMVDVVSLSMGYLFERPESEEAQSPIAVQIGELRNRGVLVVAAAGNSASAQRFFPACLSTFSNALTTPPVISVGALNPNGSKALFTNEGPSVTCYATGTNVISTFPQDANASRQPLVQVPAVNRPDLPQYRQSPDVDDHTHSPFTVWTGSSFAAPHVAAHLAKALHDMAPVAVTGLGSAEQAMKRAAAAVDAVKDAAKPKTTPPVPAP